MNKAQWLELYDAMHSVGCGFLPGKNFNSLLKLVGDEIKKLDTTCVLDERNINSLERVGLRKVIERTQHAHMVDLRIRINGRNEWYQADWIKHLEAPPLPQTEAKPPINEKVKQCLEMIGGSIPFHI